MVAFCKRFATIDVARSKRIKKRLDTQNFLKKVKK